jgi:hypothetical protein
MKAQAWAALGPQFLKLDNNGKATRDLNVLKKESSKLRDLSTAFGMLLRTHGESQDPRQKIEIVCFYEEFDTRVAKVNIGRVGSQKSHLVRVPKGIPAD